MSRWRHSTCMTTYSVIIGSPPGGSILPSGTFGSLGWLTNASTPAERLNMAFRLGNTGSASKSGCMKARYSISANSPGSGQMRISRSGSCSAKVSRQAFALPIRLSRSTMSSAIAFPMPLSPPSGLRASLVEIGDVAGRCRVAQSRPPRHRERRDRGLVFGDLGHDRFLGAIEDAAISGDEVLGLAQSGEIPVDFRHDVAGHHVPTAHRVFRVSPVMHKANDGAKTAADFEHGFDPFHQVIRGAD